MAISTKLMPLPFWGGVLWLLILLWIPEFPLKAILLLMGMMRSRNWSMLVMCAGFDGVVLHRMTSCIRLSTPSANMMRLGGWTHIVQGLMSKQYSEVDYSPI